MSLNLNLKKVGEPVTLWPNREPVHKRCTMLDRKSGQEYEVTLHVTEIELILKLMNLRDRLNKSDREIAHVLELIDNYADRKYAEGVESVEIQPA